MDNIREISILVEKWSKTGLLDKLTISESIKIANYLEYASKLLIDLSKNETIDLEGISGIIFASIRRYADIVHAIGIESYCEHVVSLNDKYQIDYTAFKNIFPTAFNLIDFDYVWMGENLSDYKSYGTATIKF